MLKRNFEHFFCGLFFVKVFFAKQIYWFMQLLGVFFNALCCYKTVNSNVFYAVKRNKKMSNTLAEDSAAY
jgi:hypothetical protein